MDTPLQKTSYSLNTASISDSEDAVRFARAKFMRVLQAWAVDRLADKRPATSIATADTTTGTAATTAAAIATASATADPTAAIATADTTATARKAA